MRFHRNINSASVCFQFSLFFLDLHLAALVWMSSRKRWVCIFEIWIFFRHSCSWPHMQSVFCTWCLCVLCGLSLQSACYRLWASIMDIITIYQSVGRSLPVCFVAVAVQKTDPCAICLWNAVLVSGCNWSWRSTGCFGSSSNLISYTIINQVSKSRWRKTPLLDYCYLFVKCSCKVKFVNWASTLIVDNL